jgi:hypothetical protein
MKSELLSIKELAAELKRGRNYVGAMVRLGFPMPGGRATVEAALVWLEKNPKPRSRCATVRRGAPKGVQLRASRT